MNAIIFDLDDTLYRRRRWRLSGFAALARHLEVAGHLSRGDVFRLLANTLRSGHGDEAFQRLCRRFDLDHDLIPGFVSLVRRHRPAVRLSLSTRQVLVRLRPAWRLGVLTNGLPTVQARKVAALGLRAFVDQVVYAESLGRGKPSPRPFLEIAARLGVPPARCVFVGDDRWHDIHGARQVGMRTVRIRRRPAPTPPGDVVEAEAVIEHLGEVEGVASGLIGNVTDDADDNLRACG